MLSPKRPHVERVIAADDHAVGAHAIDEMPRRLRIVRKRVEIEPSHQFGRRSLRIHLGLRPDVEAVDEAPDLIRNVAAAVRQQDPQLLQLVERAAEHEVRDHHRRVEREPD
jgi:hypothetical protein